MRNYSCTMTGWAASVIAFDALWCFTKMDVFEIFFLALCAGFVAAGMFLFLTEKREVKRGRPTYVKDEATQLEFMPMKHGRVA